MNKRHNYSTAIVTAHPERNKQRKGHWGNNRRPADTSGISSFILLHNSLALRMSIMDINFQENRTGYSKHTTFFVIKRSLKILRAGSRSACSRVAFPATLPTNHDHSRSVRCTLIITLELQPCDTPPMYIHYKQPCINLTSQPCGSSNHHQQQWRRKHNS